MDAQKIKQLAINGLETDGAHHKQWYLEQILIALDLNLEQLHSEEQSNDYDWEPGIAP